MGNPPNNQNDIKVTGFKRYASKRIATAVVLIALVIWAFSWIPESAGRGGRRGEDQVTGKTHQHESTAHSKETVSSSVEKVEKIVLDNGDHRDAVAVSPSPTHAEESHTPSPEAKQATQHDDANETEHGAEGGSSEAQAPLAPEKETKQGVEPAPHDKMPSEQEKDAPPHGADSETEHEDLATGVAFTNATIASLEFELNERFWGWRPNDIINVTDNVNNFQLGVLEVTRRTVVLLAKRISRTGTTDAFNPHLENAMNWLMIRSSRYWFPSPESKYKESIEEVKAYRAALMNGRGSFYTRTDNLIPLLLSFEDLLGSCDENLVKQKNGDGSKVSLFKADDYFYYAKGVANTMATVLEAVHHDFNKTLESRHAAELLHHALESCRQAAALAPLLVTNGDLDGILSNHRANMAAPISHARFYISQLIKTLAT